MIHSCTSFGKLKTAVVGRELDVQSRCIDSTFKIFYKEAIGQLLYDDNRSEYKISKELIDIRNEQLDGLAEVLEKLGVEVLRPAKTNLKRIETPTFKTYGSSASNVRDLTLVYNDTIVETPTFIRNRVYENLALYSAFSKAFDNGRGGKWVKAPLTSLVESSIDSSDWRKERDFSNVPDDVDMAIDAAQFLRIGKDVIVNVATYNHFLGFKWVQSLFPETTFHVVKIADNHIDGALVCLKPGVFLCNPNVNANLSIPPKFKSWTVIEPDVTQSIDVSGATDCGLRIASSAGMDINVLSVDENTVVVSERAVGVIRALEKNGFDVIPVKLDLGEVFGGGIHCSTLDIYREDEYIDYT